MCSRPVQIKIYLVSVSHRCNDDNVCQENSCLQTNTNNKVFDLYVFVCVCVYSVCGKNFHFYLQMSHKCEWKALDEQRIWLFRANTRKVLLKTENMHAQWGKIWQCLYKNRIYITFASKSDWHHWFYSFIFFTINFINKCHVCLETQVLNISLILFLTKENFPIFI